MVILLAWFQQMQNKLTYPSSFSTHLYLHIGCVLRHRNEGQDLSAKSDVSKSKSLGLFRFPLQHVRIFLDTGTGVMAANVKSIEEKAMFVHVGYRLQRALSKEDEEGMVALLTAGTVRRGLFSTSTSNFVIATLHAPR